MDVYEVIKFGIEVLPGMSNCRVADDDVTFFLGQVKDWTI